MRLARYILSLALRLPVLLVAIVMQISLSRYEPGQSSLPQSLLHKLFRIAGSIRLKGQRSRKVELVSCSPRGSQAISETEGLHQPCLTKQIQASTKYDFENFTALLLSIYQTQNITSTIKALTWRSPSLLRREASMILISRQVEWRKNSNGRSWVGCSSQSMKRVSKIIALQSKYEVGEG